MLRKPRPLRHGDTVAIVSLASYVQRERVERGILALESRGFRVRVGAHALARGPQYFAGEYAERLEDLHGAFAEDEVRAILCTRGGYGSNYLLDGLDLDLIRSNPKPLFAYSDMTALQTWLLQSAGLPAFHGPMVSADFAEPEGVHEPSFSAATTGSLYRLGPAEGLRMLRAGRAEGVLAGGCLSLLTASLGTRFAPELAGRLLFLEDVGENPYQIDRMLRQLILAGRLEGVRGFVFGEMKDCVRTEEDRALLEAVILRVLADFPGPIAIGLRSGHVSRQNVTLTFGLRAELNTEGEPSLALLEPAVEV